MRIAGSFPFLPHRFIVKEETRSREATSRMVIKSGRSASDTFGSALVLYDMERIIVFYLEVVKMSRIGEIQRKNMNKNIFF